MTEKHLLAVYRKEAEMAAAEVVLAAWFSCVVKGAWVYPEAGPGETARRVHYGVPDSTYAAGKGLPIRLGGVAMQFLHTRGVFAAGGLTMDANLDAYVGSLTDTDILINLRPGQEPPEMRVIVDMLSEPEPDSSRGVHDDPPSGWQVRHEWVWEQITQALARAAELLERPTLAGVVQTVAQILCARRHVTGKEVVALVEEACSSVE